MKFNFEKRNAPEMPIGNREIDAAYERACKILSEPIDPRDFKDYKDVEEDIACVQRLERSFAAQDAEVSPEMRKSMKLGKIFEAIIFEHAEQSNWFGESATTTAASRYDDYINKVDAIVEFPEEKAGASHLALAMDITIAGSFGEKFDHIKQGIDAGTLTEIKYFASEHLNIRGRKDKVPHVIIGVDRQTLYDVIKAWMQKDTKALADHPVQVKILEEIRLQLIAYRTYAEGRGKNDLSPIFQKTEEIIASIITEKGITAEDRKEAGRDDMFDAIRFNAQHLSDRKSPRRP